MNRISITLSGRGGHALDYAILEVADVESVTDTVIEWLTTNHVILSAGDTIAIAEVE